MRKIPIIFFVTILLVLAASSSVANASFSKVFTDGTLTVPAGISGLSPYSESWAEAWDSTPNSDLDDDWGYVTNTDALANIGSASQHSWTTNLYVASKALAAPPQFVESDAWGGAGQYWEFTATAGYKTFTLDYTISQDMATDVIGEWANVYESAYLYLENETSGQQWVAYSCISKHVQDGDSFSRLDTRFLSVEGKFLSGDTGYVVFEAYSDAEAYTIPAPGAILLGGIGVGLVGWLKRRRFILEN